MRNCWESTVASKYRCFVQSCQGQSGTIRQGIQLQLEVSVQSEIFVAPGCKFCREG